MGEASKPALIGGVGETLGTLGGDRTPNLLVRSQALYPLSYEGMCALSDEYTSAATLTSG